MKRRFAATELGPFTLYLIILGIVFVCELCVMLILPSLPLESAPSWLVGAIDASFLTLLLVPLFGMLIVRPLQHMVRVRAELLQQFIALQEDERGRIARDLHDEIGQSFTSVLIGLRTIDPEEGVDVVRGRLDELADIVNATVEEVRRLARGLRPAVLDHLGLVRAIEQLAEDFQVAQKIEVRLAVHGLDTEYRLPTAVETAVYRIVQESLTNITRHACAKSVEIDMDASGPRLKVEITDDGEGFSKKQIRELSSTGILGMTERAAAIRGRLQIESDPGKGTRVLLQLPLSKRSSG
ncbi:MAG: sensor histidine kinase [Pirellulales bacterium]